MSTANWAVPPVGTVTECEPRSAAATKSPCCDTSKLTVSGAFGAGAAVIVKVAASPSVAGPPPVTVTSGTGSSPAMVTVKGAPSARTPEGVAPRPTLKVSSGSALPSSSTSMAPLPWAFPAGIVTDANEVMSAPAPVTVAVPALTEMGTTRSLVNVPPLSVAPTVTVSPSSASTSMPVPPSTDRRSRGRPSVLWPLCPYTVRVAVRTSANSPQEGPAVFLREGNWSEMRSFQVPEGSSPRCRVELKLKLPLIPHGSLHPYPPSQGSSSRDSVPAGDTSLISRSRANSVQRPNSTSTCSTKSMEVERVSGISTTCRSSRIRYVTDVEAEAVCIAGNSGHSNARSTAADASTRPKPYLWL